MPFTLAHPAIILPLNKLGKKWVSLTGLVMGSLVPDFEYFIRMEFKKVYTHTWKGLFLYDILLSLLLVFLFHNIVRNSLINNLPPSLQGRLNRFKTFNWNERFKKSWFTVIVSIIIGEMSHFAWDSFTHGKYFIRYIPSFQDQLSSMHYIGYIFFFLQMFSSVMGVVAVLNALWRLPVEPQIKVNTQVSSYWILTLSIVFIVFTSRVLFGKPIDAVEGLIILISAFFIAFMLTPVLFKLTANKFQFKFLAKMQA